ncbi:MAG: T9SS type A sorting domain-containing protein, partial [Bacteroidota bacterium]
VDISIPCGTISSFSNSAGLPMEMIYEDSITGITGLRIHGLPAWCQDSTGQGPFTVTYEICGLANSCADDFCLPMVGYYRNGCVQYEDAIMGTVLPTPPSNEKVVMEENCIMDVYPNPVAGQGNVRVMFAYDTKVRVEVYDLTGVKHAVLYDGELKAETEKVLEVRTEKLPVGMYIVRMMAEDGEGTAARMIVLE